ncbi:MAG: hypothetical protein M1818_002679 [Claussenomyces sp. TS43310]|nr:MAG: hypothetical protein M1818_002679 [Claussenomyces sp. TS43310]
MAHDHRPIQNSEVYVLNPASHASHPPPPSPPTPCEPRALSPAPSDGMPITPPFPVDQCDPLLIKHLSTAVHVLGTEATALSCLTRLYETDPVAREGFHQAVNAITSCMACRGKIVISGVGKSGHIAKKLVATMNSLGISATFLHPTEALHGDLGKVGDHDVILFITFSGRTPELLALIPHLSSKLQFLAITSHIHPSTCAIVDVRPNTILLPAPIHEPEVLSFGVSAPTTSTTIALALGDALAVAISNELHPSVSEVFLQNHPGGAIGQTMSSSQILADIAVPLEDVPEVDHAGASPKAVHVIMQGYQSSSGWVRCGDEGLASPRRIQRLQPEDMNTDATKIRGLLVPRKHWYSLPGEIRISDAITRIEAARNKGEAVGEDTILAAVVDGHITGVLEAATILINL